MRLQALPGHIYNSAHVLSPVPHAVVARGLVRRSDFSRLRTRAHRIFAGTSSHPPPGRIDRRPLAARHILIVLMLLLTVISQFAISPKMHAIRAEVGVIDTVPPDSPQRLEFNRLHVWSEKFEEAVLLLGLVALYMTAQALRER